MSETDILDEGAVAETATDQQASRKAPLPEHCYACGEKVVGQYCHACGQKNDDCRRSIFSLARETLTSVFSIDSKFFRTLGLVLAWPGRYVRQYGDGERSSYTPPIRFFLVISFIFFSAMALTDTYFLTMTPKLATDDDGSIVASVTDTAGNRQNIELNISFLQRPEDIAYTEEDAEMVRNLITGGFEEAEIPDLSGDERQEVRQAVTSLTDRINQVAANPKPFNIALNGWLPRLMFLMMPVMALFGLLFIRGKDALVYDHLILSLNFHAVMFLTLVFALFAARYVPGNFLGTMFVVFLLAYYLLTLRGAFGRGWVKSAFATLFVFLGYVIVLSSSLFAVSALAIRDIT